jgi:hypothetical protein
VSVRSTLRVTKLGEPRVDGYAMAGIDLLFRWDFKPSG